MPERPFSFMKIKKKVLKINIRGSYNSKNTVDNLICTSPSSKYLQSYPLNAEPTKSLKNPQETTIANVLEVMRVIMIILPVLTKEIGKEQGFTE